MATVPVSSLSSAGTILSTDQVVVTRNGEDLLKATIADLFADAALTGAPTAPTATFGSADTKIATTAFVSDAVEDLIDGLEVLDRTAAGTLTGDEYVLSVRLSSSVSITATTISAQASDQSFNDSGSGLVAAGFAVGDRVNVTGFTGDTANNLLTGKITDLTTDKMTIGGADGLVIVDDAAGESVTITKWEAVRTTAQDIGDLGSGGGGSSATSPISYTIDTGSTSDADPGNGVLAFNNATQSSATEIYMDNQTVAAAGLTTYLASLGQNGFITLTQVDDITVWRVFKITAISAETGYYKLTVENQAGEDSFADEAEVSVVFDTAGAGTSTAGKHMIPVPASAMFPSAVSPCSDLTLLPGATNQPSDQVLYFDPDTREFAEFSFEMPESWNEGTISFIPVWSHGSTTTNFGTVWTLDAVAVGNDDALAATFGSVGTSVDTGGTTNDLYKGPESAAITVAGSPAVGDTVFCRVSRLAANGSDTLAIDARLHGIRLYITTDAETDA